jgi:hypothetical protein
MTRAFAVLLAARRGWSPARVALFDAGFARYWSRSADLARQTTGWSPPRRRHVVIVQEPHAVRPYAQLLNTSAWTLWADDIDPEGSHPELLAWLLALGDRMAMTGEVAPAAVQNAAWWFERTDAECDAFRAAAAASTRLDAESLRAVAAALPWLRRLRHETLCPAPAGVPHRSIPGTGLLVPRDLEPEPPALVERMADVSRVALTTWRAAWRRSAPDVVRRTCDRLVETAPPLLVTGQRGRIVWDPDRPTAVGALRAELSRADAVAVDAIAADLAVVERHTRAFLGAVVDLAALPMPHPDAAQAGLAYLHHARRLLAYDLHEPGMERLVGPPLPFGREMLGARAAHEWAHLADEAGWVPRTVSETEYAARESALADLLDATIAAAPAAVRARTAADLASLAGAGSAGAGLAHVTVQRMPDWRANLVARAFMTPAERETYVRHNVRTLRPEYPAASLWRMLVRYLYEVQYLGPRLGLTTMPDPRAYFVHSTWFADDLLSTGVLDEARFDALVAAVDALCACWAVDPTRLRLPGHDTGPRDE